MSAGDFGIIVLCLFGGYWAVSFVLDRSKGTNANPATPNAPATMPAMEPADADWRALLNVDSNANIEAIRKAYHDRVAELDRAKAQAHDDSTREAVQHRLFELRLAYEQACRARGAQP